MSFSSFRQDLSAAVHETAADFLAPWQREPALARVPAPPEVARRIALHQFRTQVNQFAANVWSAGAGLLIWAFVLWHFEAEAPAWIWLAAALLHVFVMAGVLGRFRLRAPPDEDIPGWIALCGRMNLSMNVLWGLLGFVLPPGMAVFSPYLAIALLLVMSSELSLYAVYRPSIAWVLPGPLLMALYLVMQGRVLDGGIALGLLIATGLLIRLARLQNTLMTQAQVLAEERVALLAELEDQRAAAQRANEDKTRFLAMVSHDLRQPMHSISLLTGALRDRSGARGDTGDGEIVGQIVASVQAMDEMLGALMDVSRLDDGTLPLQVGPLSLKPLLFGTALQFAAQAGAKGLSFQVDPGAAVVLSDAYQLQRVVANLVANAIRYTTHGSVRVRCRRRGSRVWLQVWDTGVGIARADRQRIFDEFVQVESTDGHRSTGLGLGLAIVNRVAQRLGHPVVVRSRPGRGSMFAIGVPLDTQAGQASATEVDLASLSRGLEGQLVLLIDDDAAVLAGMKAWLTHFDCHVLAATSVAQALSALDEARCSPDLILSDYRLVGDTGLAAIRRVRAHVNEATPALLVTAEADAVRALAREQGIEVLGKPLQVHALAAALDRALRASAQVVDTSG